MRVAVMTAPGEVRVEDRPEPEIIEPTDAIVRLAATCICGSDLWPYRGVEAVDAPRPMGHEYAGIVEEVGSAVTAVRPGQFVVGSFFASDNTCEICRSGYQSSCVRREAAAPGGAQAEYLRVPLADGTLVATPDIPPHELIPSLLAASDVLGTGWFAAVAAEAGPGKTVAVVGDGQSDSWPSWQPSNSAPSGLSPCPGTRSGRNWPATTARPTSSKSAVKPESKRSKNSPGALAPTPWLRQLAPRNPSCRQWVPPVVA